MKRFVASALAAAAIFSAPAFAATLAQWTFESSIPATAGPFSPEVGTGSTQGSHAAASTYSSPVGDGSAHSFSSTAWAVNDYYQFSTSATGFSSLVIDWDQTSSNTGPRDFVLMASTDGTTFSAVSGTLTVLANATPNTPWSSATYNAAYHYTVSLSAAYDNAATVTLRVQDASTTSANGSTVASGGTDRVDNFTITAAPEPASLALLGLGVLAVIRRR